MNFREFFAFVGKRLWQFTSKNLVEDWDAYLALGLSVVFGVLGIVGVKDEEKIQLAIAAACGTMALIAISLLKERSQRKLAVEAVSNVHNKLAEPIKNMIPQLERLEKLPLDKILSYMQSKDSLSIDTLVDYGPKDIAVIKSAKRDVLIIQETASELALLQDEIVPLLKAGKKVRLLTASDDPAVIRMLSFRNEILTPDEILERLESASKRLSTIARIAAEHSGNLIVRYLPYPTDITGVFCDGNSEHPVERTALVRFQGFRIKLSEKPFLMLSTINAPALYSCFQSQATLAWLSSIKCVFLTGKPRVGKSTLLKNVVELLRQQGKNVRGVLTSEVLNPKGERDGFECISLADGTQGSLAKKTKEGKYDVNERTMRELVIPQLKEGIGKSDVLVVDEVGPIQRKVPEFMDVVANIIASRTTSVLGIVSEENARQLHSLPGGFRVEIIPITEATRADLVNVLLTEFVSLKHDAISPN